MTVPTEEGVYEFDIADGPYAAWLVVDVPDPSDRKRHGFETRAEVRMGADQWESYDDWQRDDENPELLDDVRRVLGARNVVGWTGPWVLLRNDAARGVQLRRPIRGR